MLGILSQRNPGLAFTDVITFPKIVLLINSLGFWNELLLSLIMLTKPELRTLPSAMMMFVGENAADFAMAAASLVTAMVPILVLYILLSDKFIEGITAGALKG